jgi:hypothetical protein
MTNYSTILLVSIFFPLVAYSQPFVEADSAEWVEDRKGVSSPCWANRENFIVKPGETWPILENEYWPCSINELLGTSPREDWVIGVRVHGGDCHAVFDYYWRINYAKKRLEYKVVDIYGGCRAGGPSFLRVTHLPAPPEGFSVWLIDVQVERDYSVNWAAEIKISE